MYETIKALRWGEVIDLDGILLKMDVDENGLEREIGPGDLYVAERNTGPKLLTAERVVAQGESENGFGGWIEATTMDYSYDIPECVKVVEA
jgi:hypothetical protein